MRDSGTWVLGAIVGAEIAFWAFLVLGLVVRYLMRRRTLSTVLLLGVPLTDLALIVLVTIDLAHGASPTFAHGLAAVYLGFSVGFGHHVVTRADAWFAHRFAGGPRPAPAPRSGPAQLTHDWREWMRVLVAWAVSVAGLLLMQAVSADGLPPTVEGLLDGELGTWIGRLTLVAGIWLLAGPVWTMLFPGRPVPDRDGER